MKEGLKIEQVCGDEDQIWTVGWGKGRAWGFESGSARFVRFVGGVLRSLQLTFVGGVGFGFVQSLLSEGFFRDFVITQKSFFFFF